MARIEKESERSQQPIPQKQMHSSQSSSPPWTIEDSKKLYRIEEWGQPYFSINAHGHIIVTPQGDRGEAIDLYQLVQALRQRNLELPTLICFPDILADRIERLNTCFASAIARYNYTGRYQGVYPIKCNQQRHLVEALVRCGRPYQFGLEVGSKPELTIALATLAPTLERGDVRPTALLICNGYKDREYIETALLAIRLGHTPILVIEQLEELELALSVSQELSITPILGIRAKLSAKGTGHWQESTGDRAKFGLAIPEILKAIRQLEANGMLNCLQLLHFHIGSQISSIGTIKDAIREASQIYGELLEMGANMKYLDVGGGLAVDYDGSKTNFPASKNYNMQNYANDIVAALQEVCEIRHLQAPTLVSESGRAIVSHQTVLIFDILSTSEPSAELPQPLPDKEHLLFRSLWETYESISRDNYQEAYHDAIQCKEEAISLFNFGYLSLQERGRIEQLYWACCQKIFAITRQQEYVPDDLADLEANLASIYYANLSVFRSVPDSWSIDQLFPILPIHRLNEEPTQRGILADLTCDSDGKIDKFIDLVDLKTMLELHPLQNCADRCQYPNQRAIAPYYLGIFLVGAYQEIMGNLHNLFGTINSIFVRLSPQGYQIEHIVKGDTIREVLSQVQYESESLEKIIRNLTEKARKENRITLEESQRLLQNYERSLERYTYLSQKDDRHQ